MRGEMRRYRYRWGEGMWSHLFHRVSGAALALYVLMHVWVVHHVLEGREAYDGLMKLLHHPLLRVGEALLLAAVLYHSVNGIRLILMDFGMSMRTHRAGFWVVFCICAALGIVGGAFLVFGV